MATTIWLGHALAVAQVQRAPLSGTWANTDTMSVTINGKTVAHTLTTEGNTYSEILTNAALSLNGSEVAEFAEMTFANYSNTHLEATGDTAGKPFTAATSEVTAGNGELGDFAIATGVKGPHCLNTAENWSAGSLPTNGDSVVFEYSAVDCMYELDALAAVQPASLTIRQSYTGKIGLPRTNQDDASTYVEYRPRYLEIGPTVVSIGDGDGSGSGRIMLDFGGNDANVTVYDKSSRAETGIPAVLLKGTNSSNQLCVIRGDVGVAFFAGETADLSGGLNITYRTSEAGDAEISCGSGTTLGDVAQSGGKLTIASNATTIDQYAGQLTLKAAAAITTLTAEGTIYDYSSGTIGTLNLTGVYDHSQATVAKTITNAILYAGATYRDPHGVITLTNGLDLYRCKPSDVSIVSAPHQTWTPTAI